MSSSSPDPREFKATQRETWDSVAAGWRRWWRIFEAGAQSVNVRLVELAEIRPGHRVLDIATGIGEPALTAARQVGERGRVVATDLAPQMLAVARERVLEEGFGNVELVEADAENLALEPESFDAATCRWGLMLMLDPVAACRGIRRTLKPGARFAAAVWGEAERVPFIAIPIAIAQREAGLPTPPPGTPGPLALGKPGQLEQVMLEAGLRDPRSESITVTLEFASPREYTGFLKDLSGSLKRALEEQPEPVRERVWKAVEREAKRHRGAGGHVRLENEVRLVSAAR